MRIIIISLFLSLASGPLSANALCNADPQLLITNCQKALKLGFSEPASRPDGAELVVTGTYSSGDRLGVEGLAVMNGAIKSRRLQTWDGLVYIYANGRFDIQRRDALTLHGQSFDIRNIDAARALLELAKERGDSLFQSHLLIHEGALDLRAVDGAPRFKRRILFTAQDGHFGVWESLAPLSLFEAAERLLKAYPQITNAVNLDMGAYNFCRDAAGADCGRLGVDPARLTNLLSFGTDLGS